MATLTALGFSIFSTYDGRGVSQARRDLSELAHALDKGNSKLKSAATSFFSLTTAAAALGPALVPISAGILGVSAATATMAVSAGAGLGLLGAALVGNVKQVLSLNTGVGKLGDNLALQKTILSQLTPGTSAYEKELKKVHTAQDRYNHALASASPIQKVFLNDVLGMKEAWQKFLMVTQQPTLHIAINLVAGLRDAIGKLAPVVLAIAPMFVSLSQKIQDWLRGSGLQNYINLIKTTAVPVLHNLIRVATDVGRVFGDFFRVFAGEGVKMSAVLARGADALRRWADNGGFARFLDTVHKNAPTVRQFFDALGKALANVGSALVKMGPSALSLSTVLLKLVAALPPTVIQAIAYAIIAVRGAMLAWSVIAPIVTSELFAMAVAEMAAALPLYVVVGIILLVVAAFAALVIGIVWLVTHWTTAWNAIKMVAETVWNFLTHGWGMVILSFTPIGWIIALATHWHDIWNGMKVAVQAIWNAMQTAWHAVVQAFSTVWTAVSGALKTAWNAVWNAMKASGQAVWNAMKVAWDALSGAFKATLNALSSAMKTVWNAMWTAIRTVANGAWTALKASWDAFKGAFTATANALKTAFTAVWNAMWTAIRTVANGAWTALKASWNAFKDAFTATANALKTAFTAVWNAMWSGIRKIAVDAWDALKTSMHAFSTAFTTATTALMGALKTAWDAGAKAIGAAWAAVKKLVRDPIQAVVSVVYNNGIVKLWNLVAGVFGAPKLSAFTLPAFATGGPVHGPGTSTSDSVVARLSTGEHVWSAKEVAAAGGHGAMLAMREGVMGNHSYKAAPHGNGMGGFPFGGSLPGPLGAIAGAVSSAIHAVGGVASAAFNIATGFGGDILGKLKSLALGAVGAVVNPLIQKAANVAKDTVKAIIPGTPFLETLIAGGNTTALPGPGIPGNGVLAGSTTKTTGMIQMMADAVKNWITAHDVAPTTGGGNTAGAQKWADAQVGKPYSLGAFGSAFDCSSYMSGIAQIILGHAPSPLFTTFAFTGAAQGPATFQKDLKAPFMVGVENQGIGHMAGTLNGKNYEATPPVVRSGPGARGAGDAMFTMHYGMKSSTLGGVIPAGNHKAIIDAALKAAGVPPPGTLAEWEAGLNTLITRESNWNAGAINLTDSNAVAGHPSQGLAQMIPSTFAANHVAGTANNILDPIANVAAAIRYIVGRYGNITNVQQANASLPPKGYWTGTGNAKQGWHRMGEHGPEMWFDGGEKVWDAKKTQDWVKRKSATAVADTAPVVVNVTNNWHGNPTKEAVQHVEGQMCDKLRMAVMAGTGKRSQHS